MGSNQQSDLKFGCKISTSVEMVELFWWQCWYEYMHLYLSMNESVLFGSDKRCNIFETTCFLSALAAGFCFVSYFLFPTFLFRISLRCSVGFKSGNILVQVSGVKLYSQTLVWQWKHFFNHYHAGISLDCLLHMFCTHVASYHISAPWPDITIMSAQGHSTLSVLEKISCYLTK